MIMGVLSWDYVTLSSLFDIVLLSLSIRGGIVQIERHYFNELSMGRVDGMGFE